MKDLLKHVSSQTFRNIVYKKEDEVRFGNTIHHSEGRLDYFHINV